MSEKSTKLEAGIHDALYVIRLGVRRIAILAGVFESVESPNSTIAHCTQETNGELARIRLELCRMAHQIIHGLDEADGMTEELWGEIRGSMATVNEIAERCPTCGTSGVYPTEDGGYLPCQCKERPNAD